MEDRPKAPELDSDEATADDSVAEARRAAESWKATLRRRMREFEQRRHRIDAGEMEDDPRLRPTPRLPNEESPDVSEVAASGEEDAEAPRQHRVFRPPEIRSGPADAEEPSHLDPWPDPDSAEAPLEGPLELPADLETATDTPEPGAGPRRSPEDRAASLAPTPRLALESDVSEPALETTAPVGPGPVETTPTIALASASRRALAFMVDLSLITLATCLNIAVVARVVKSPPSVTFAATPEPFIVFAALVALSYLTAFVAFRGQTPGLALMHCEVTLHGGGQVPAGRALIRAVTLLVGSAACGLSGLFVLIDPERRSLADLFAGTEVVERELREV